MKTVLTFCLIQFVCVGSAIAQTPLISANKWPCETPAFSKYYTSLDNNNSVATGALKTDRAFLYVAKQKDAENFSLVCVTGPTMFRPHACNGPTYQSTTYFILDHLTLGSHGKAASNRTACFANTFGSSAQLNDIREKGFEGSTDIFGGQNALKTECVPVSKEVQNTAVPGFVILDCSFSY